MTELAHGRALSHPEKLDISAIRALAPLIETTAGRAVGAVGNLGDQPPLFGLAALVLGWGLVRRDARLARTGADMLLAHGIATAVKTAGKNRIDRSRPRQLLKHGEYRMQDGHSRDPALRSFPSGHAAGAVAVACAAARGYPRHRAAAYGAAAGIGALQIPRRAHYPSDVLAGAAIGGCAELLANWMLDRAGALFARRRVAESGS